MSIQTHKPKNATHSRTWKTLHYSPTDHPINQPVANATVDMAFIFPTKTSLSPNHVVAPMPPTRGWSSVDVWMESAMALLLGTTLTSPFIPTACMLSTASPSGHPIGKPTVGKDLAMLPFAILTSFVLSMVSGKSTLSNLSMSPVTKVNPLTKTAMPTGFGMVTTPLTNWRGKLWKR